MKDVTVLSSNSLWVESLTEFFGNIPDFSAPISFSDFSQWLSAGGRPAADVLFADESIVSRVDFLPLLKTAMENIPPVVVLSGDGIYAARSYEVPAVSDYLVMPCSPERFFLCLERLKKQLSLYPAQQRVVSPKEYTFIKVNKKFLRLPFEDIYYVESVKDYIKVVCEKKSFLVYNTLGNFTASLPADRFVRIHRSYTVAIDKIDWFDSNQVEIMGVRLPVTRKYFADSPLKNFR